MKEYRIVENVAGLFCIEIKTEKRVGIFRKKIEVWKVANIYGHTESEYLPRKRVFYKSLREAKNQLERFKIGKIIHYL